MPYKKFVGLQVMQLLVLCLVSFACFAAVAYSESYQPTPLDLPDTTAGWLKELLHIAVWFLSLSLAVFLETLITQHCIFLVYKAVRHGDVKNSMLPFIIISSLLFSLAHLINSLQYPAIAIAFRMIVTFLGGVIFATSYYILFLKKQHPLLSVFLLHLIYDLFAAVVEVGSQFLGIPTM